MKKGILLLAFCILLLSSGCAAMLERSHVSSTAHADYAVMEDDSVLRAETYQGLVNSLLYFIREHSESGSIRLYNYTGDVVADLSAARDEVLEQDPTGAFAVRTLDYDSTRILTYYEIEVRISYSRTAQEVAEVKPLSSVSALRQELARMVAERQEKGVFQISYFSGDAELVDTMLRQSIYNAPALYRYPGGAANDLDYSIVLYPEMGTRRIVEVKVRWPGSSWEADEQVRGMQRAAEILLEANPPAGEAYTPEELAAIVRSASGGLDYHGTSIPLDVLTGSPAREDGLLLAAEYLCQYCGMEAMMVFGESPEYGAIPWIIVSTQEGYRHLLSAPFFTQNEDGTQPPFQLYTDLELQELGYSWPAGFYPACVGDPAVPQEEEQEPAPARTDEGEQP